MKKVCLNLLLAVSMFMFVGCQSQSGEMTLLDHIAAISISESGGYGGINENFFVSIHDVETVAAFESIFERARATDETLMKEKPDYDILVRYENGETHLLHLTHGSEGQQSRVSYVGHEKDGYVISSEDTATLREIIDR